MTARALQKVIVKDLSALFEHDRYKVPPPPQSSERRTAAPGIYEQDLPIQDVDADDDLFPYIIVRLNSGSINTQTDPHKIAVLLLIGIYDDDKRNIGHEAVMEIIERIQMHYEGEPFLDAFRFADPFQWALQDEPSYPYFYGAVNINFDAPAPRVKGSELV